MSSGKAYLRLGCRAVLFYCLICVCTQTINSVRAQEVEVGHWLWAGQTLSDVVASQSRIINRCKRLSAKCHSSSLRVLVRSWKGEDGRASTQHQTPRLLPKGSSVILSYRLEYLIDDKEIGAAIRRDINIWHHANRHVDGVEIDFDSPSAKLEDYRRWLTDLQGNLTDEIKSDITFGITGLPTWFEDNKKQANNLARSVDEISLMFYRQEKTPITQHLLSAITKVDNIRYAFLCDDKRWKALVRETKKNEMFRMAIFLTSRCVDIGEPAPS